MKNYWLSNTTQTPATAVARVFGVAFASVCPQHLEATPMRKRTVDGVTAAAHKGMGPAPWSPPTD